MTSDEKQLLKIQKKSLIEREIVNVWRRFRNSGVSLHHVQKVKKYYFNANEVVDDAISLSEFAIFLEKVHRELVELALEVENNFIKELKAYSKNDDEVKIDKEVDKLNLTDQERQVWSVIKKVVNEYRDKGLLDKHVKKARDYYFALAREKHDDFDMFLKKVEEELYVLAEETKKNYIEGMKNMIVSNPRFSKDSRERMENNIFLSREEKEMAVKGLIDSIAKEYSNEGLFERHIKKAYSIFLNKKEVCDSSLSLADFEKFLARIEEELYQLAEETKKNYERDFQKAVASGKVLRKGVEL